jgi:hypothetical protein
LEEEMTKNLKIKNAEKQAFRLAIFEDGIWEIYLGIIFTLLSAYSITRELLGPAINVILVLGVILALVVIAWFAKKRITQPRIGLVKFSPGTVKVIRKANLYTWGLVIFTFILMILGANQLINGFAWGNLPEFVSDFGIDLFFALIMVGIFSLSAYVIGAPRFYVYGLLLGAGNFISTVLHAYYQVSFQWPTALAGLIIAVIGIYILAKFIRSHPIARETVHG